MIYLIGVFKNSRGKPVLYVGEELYEDNVSRWKGNKVICSYERYKKMKDFMLKNLDIRKAANCNSLMFDL